MRGEDRGRGKAATTSDSRSLARCLFSILDPRSRPCYAVRPKSTASIMQSHSNAPHIAFIGGGNMARSLIGGLLRDGTQASAISVSEPNDALRSALARDFGVSVHSDNAQATADAD